MSKTVFRLATSKDLPKIMLFAETSHIDKAVGVSDLLPRSLTAVLSCFKEDIDDCAIILYEKHGIIRGIMDLAISNFWWSDTKIVNNRLFYVVPEERSFKVYNQFMKMAKNIAKEANMPFVFGLFDGEELERKEKLMRNANRIGGFYVWDTSWDTR